MSESHYRGVLNKVTNQLIRGWAVDTRQVTPLEIEIFVDNNKIGTVKAEEFRKRIFERKLHKTGHCGFTFKIPSDYKIPSNCTIQAKISNTNFELKNSPYKYEKTDDLKILIVGLAKSGTSILTYRIADKFTEKTINFEPKGVDSLVDLDLQKELTKKEGVVITKSLFKHNSLRKQSIPEISALYDKKIWIIRDPRDNVLSSFFYRWNKGHNPDKDLFEKTLIKVKEKEEKPEKIALFNNTTTGFNANKILDTRYKSLITAIDKLGSDWFVLKYEDLMDANVNKLNQYLGFDINTKAEVDQRFDRVIRSKTYGGWRTWFNEEDVKHMKPIANKYLESLGYSSTDWDLISKPNMNPQEGSEYMKKLFYGTK